MEELKAHNLPSAALFLTLEGRLSQYCGFPQFPQHWAYSILLQEKMSLKN